MRSESLHHFGVRSKGRIYIFRSSSQNERYLNNNYAVYSPCIKNWPLLLKENVEKEVLYKYGKKKGISWNDDMSFFMSDASHARYQDEWFLFVVDDDLPGIDFLIIENFHHLN